MIYDPPRYPLHYFLPSVICGLSMGTGVASLANHGFSWTAAGLLALSFAMWCWGRSLQRRYFDARYRELERMFDELRSRYGK